MDRIYLWIVIAAVALLMSCSHVNMEGMIRDLRVFDSDMANLASSNLPIGYEEEMAYGGAIATEVIAAYGGLYERSKVVAYVNAVGAAVAAYSRRPDIPYFFGVLDTDEVNALSAPGGYVFITRGLLAQCESEAQLAAVLAHEVGHIAGRHGLQVIRNMKTADQAVRITDDGWTNEQVLGSLVGKFIADYLERGLPSKKEFAADQRATETLVRLGYDGAALRHFLGTLPQEKAESGDRWYDTHPDAGARLQRLDAYLAELGDEVQGAKLSRRFKRSVSGIGTR